MMRRPSKTEAKKKRWFIRAGLTHGRRAGRIPDKTCYGLVRLSGPSPSEEQIQGG